MRGLVIENGEYIGNGQTKKRADYFKRPPNSAFLKSK